MSQQLFDLLTASYVYGEYVKSGSRKPFDEWLGFEIAKEIEKDAARRNK